MFTNDFAMECSIAQMQRDLDRMSMNGLRFEGHRIMSAEESAAFDKEFAETQAWVNKIHMDVTGEPPETPEEIEEYIAKLSKEIKEFEEHFDKEFSEKFTSGFELDNEFDREFFNS